MSKNDEDILDDEHIRYVTAPLEISQIKEFFENKELFFIVNYVESKIKGNMFLTYLSNLDLPYEIDLDEASTAEKLDLVKHFMTTRNLNSSTVLKKAVAQIVLQKMGTTPELILGKDYILTNEECDLYIKANEELVEKWKVFLASTMLYMLTTVAAVEEDYNFKGQYQIIEDSGFIGLNVVQMFSLPHFMDVFYAQKIDVAPCYFKNQFEEYMFKGSNLFNYYFCKENTIPLLFNSTLSGGKDIKQFEELLSKV